MITKIIAIISLPPLLWMLIGGAKQFTEKHQIDNRREFFSELAVLVGLLFGVISLLTYIVFGEMIVISLKQAR